MSSAFFAKTIELLEKSYIRPALAFGASSPSIMLYLIFADGAGMYVSVDVVSSDVSVSDVSEL